MKIPAFRSKVLCAVLVSVVLCAPVCAQTVPHTEAETLSEKKIVLPDFVAGRPAVLIVGFSHASSSPTKEWAQRVAADYPSDAKLACLQVPILAGAPRMVRGMIRHGMKKDIPKEKYDRVALVFKDEDAWKKAADFDHSHSDDAYILLLDASGNIRWKTRGTAADHYDELKTQIAHLPAQKSQTFRGSVIAPAL
jgi:hypothetical protein